MCLTDTSNGPPKLFLPKFLSFTQFEMSLNHLCNGKYKAIAMYTQVGFLLWKMLMKNKMVFDRIHFIIASKDGKVTIEKPIA